MVRWIYANTHGTGGWKIMMEDKIIFELDKYTFERGLATVDLKTFINFCIKNQKHILKIKELEII